MRFHQVNTTRRTVVSPVVYRTLGVRLSSAAPKLPYYVLSAMLLTGFAGITPAFAAPTAPTGLDMAIASDSGLSNTDNITSNQQPTFTGKGTPLSSVKLFAGSTQIGFGIVIPNGTWVVGTNVKLANGTYNITAQQTVAGGATSASSTPLKVTIDTLAPTTTLPDLAAASDSGASSTDDITNVVKPTLQGTGTPGAYITLFLLGSGKTVGSAIVGADGHWASTWDFPAGTHDYVILAKATDLAGNAAQTGGALNITIDTDLPATPGAPDMVAASDSGVSNTDNKTNNMTPTFTVKAEPLGTVQLTAISYSAPVVGSGTANNSGVATITPATAFKNGYYNMTAVVFDRAGNRSAQASAATLIETTTAPPTTPGKPRLDAGSDSNLLDNITNINTPTLAGMSAEPNTKLNIELFAGVFHYNAVANTDKFGNWSVTSPQLLDGVYDVTAKATDEIGNSALSPVFKLTIDTYGGAAPVAPELAFWSDFGISNSDDVTNEAHHSFTGKGQPNATWKLFNHGVAVKNFQAEANGEWVVDTDLPAGPFSVSVMEFDVAGNGTVISPALNGLIDLTLPTVDFTTSAFGTSLAGLGGNAQDPTLNGDSSGLDKVTVMLRSGVTGKLWTGTAWMADSPTELPTVLTNGKWTKTTGLPTGAQAPDGVYQFENYSYDKAGNRSNYQALDLTVDTVAPQATFAAPTANAVLKTLTQITGGSSDITSGVAKVEITLKRNSDNLYWNGAAWSANAALLPTTLTSTYWLRNTSLPAGANLPNGAYTVTARTTDKCGNFSNTTQNFTVNSAGAAIPTRPSGNAS